MGKGAIGYDIELQGAGLGIDGEPADEVSIGIMDSRGLVAGGNERLANLYGSQ